MAEREHRHVPFAKMNGSGNDFILVDGMDGRMEGADLPALARGLCRRRFSIGADGLIVLVPADGADFAWRFFNADGSAAGMCGNGARCAARFARMRGIAGDRMSFLTAAGRVRAEVSGSGVKVQMTDPEDYREEFALELPAGTYRAWMVNTGVPHAVIPVEDAAGVDVAVEGRQVRRHAMFAPAGANADFISREGPGLIRVRTYERGVEAETLACGTGAVAAALVARRLGWASSPADVVTSGGSRLRVHFEGNWGAHRAVCLEGDARLVCEGEWCEDALRGD